MALPQQNVTPAADSPTGEAQVREVFDRQRAAWLAGAPPDYRQRMDDLGRLLEALRVHQDAIVEAVRADYGCRSPFETLTSEVMTSMEGIRHLRRHLRSWMQPERRAVSWMFRPGRARVMHQPLGVVGVIAPWNYPVYLALLPMATALAAGNRVMVKPSELTPNASELMRKLVAELFPLEQAAVILGGPEVGGAFSRLPFDHLLFTGSTSLGKVIMRAAAENLTPVTLELGGKSPAIVGPDFPVQKAAERIVVGKLFNVGQTCIAPDYVLVPEEKLEPLVQSIEATIRSYYPTLRDNQDYTAIINDRHYRRLRGYISDAAARGARIVEINPAGEQLEPEARKIAPTLVIGGKDEMMVMQDEIFGPVLPIVTYRTLDDAIRYVNERPRPLALYYFDYDPARIDRMMQRTTSGGVTLNDTILHVAQDDLPFGGVGFSGMGAYHGREGFETFSHRKGIFQQARLNSAVLLHAPYPGWAYRFIHFVTGRKKR